MPSNLSEAAERGRSLADQADREGWQSIAALVDKKCWLAEWKPVIAALAGKLDDPAPLIALLADAGRDDYFRHRLAVAAACLPQVNPQRRPAISKEINEITTTIMDLWERHEPHASASVISHLLPSLPHLAEVNGLMRDRPLLTWACEQLRGDGCYTAENAFYRMGPAAAQPQVVDAMIDLIRDRQTSQRAFTVLNRFGTEKATPALLRALREMVVDGHAGTAGLGSAISYLARLKDASPEVVSALLRLCLDRDDSGAVSDAAADALVLLGPFAATSEVIEPLVQVLQGRYADRRLQRRAIAVLGGMGPTAATTPVIDSLASFAQLAETPTDLSREAQNALARIQGIAVEEQTPATPCARHRAFDMYSPASPAQPLAGPEPEIQTLERMHRALDDPDEKVSNPAGWQILTSARDPDLLAAAVQKLVGQWGYAFDERLSAGSTIGSLGELVRRWPAILPQVMPKLGAAMEVIIFGLSMEPVSSEAAYVIAQIAAYGMRLFRRKQAVWEAFHVDDLAR